jgi:hypothetical protein
MLTRVDKNIIRRVDYYFFIFINIINLVSQYYWPRYWYWPTATFSSMIVNAYMYGIFTIHISENAFVNSAKMPSLCRKRACLAHDCQRMKYNHAVPPTILSVCTSLENYERSQWCLFDPPDCKGNEVTEGIKDRRSSTCI